MLEFYDHEKGTAVVKDRSSCICFIKKIDDRTELIFVNRNSTADELRQIADKLDELNKSTGKNLHKQF